MGTDNESGLRPIVFERLGGHPINSELLAAGNSALGLQREVRTRDRDVGVISTPKSGLKLGAYT